MLLANNSRVEFLLSLRPNGRFTATQIEYLIFGGYSTEHFSEMRAHKILFSRTRMAIYIGFLAAMSDEELEEYVSTFRLDRDVQQTKFTVLVG